MKQGAEDCISRIRHSCVIRTATQARVARSHSVPSYETVRETEMIKKIASIISIVALVSTLTSIPAFAQSFFGSTKAIGADGASGVVTNVKVEAQPARTLKADVSKMVADARAGKALRVVDPQNQPAQSNSLSKTVKIAIAVGVALAIVLTIVFIHERNNFFDSF